MGEIPKRLKNLYPVNLTDERGARLGQEELS